MKPKKKPNQPFSPPERLGTIRQEIISLLENNELNAKDISQLVRIPEKEVYDHLEHIQKSTSKSAHHLTVIPSQCRKCGFVFKKRERLKKPGRCPVCRNEQIQEPLFLIAKGHI